MTTFLAFLRAINVGGYAPVTMTDLKGAFAAAGCRNVRTYIKSGNVAFDAPASGSPALFAKVQTKLRSLLDDEPVVLFRTLREIEQLVRSLPFKKFEKETDAKLYVSLLAARPTSSPRMPVMSTKEALDVFPTRGLEVFVVSRRKANGTYGFPNLFIEKELGVLATTRNWNTITKFAAFARKDASG